MTFTITKAKLGIAILAMALLVPATAWATHSFDDVNGGHFYHDDVAWAKTNGITFGSGKCGPGNNFCGELNVTRGENIAFARRYDTNVVQPALTTLTGTAAANSAAIVANDVDIAGLGFSAMYWARVATDGSISASNNVGISATDNGTGSFTVDFPVDVSACSWSATQHYGAGLLINLDGFATMFSLSLGESSFFPLIVAPTEIDVVIYEEDATLTDVPFDLQVFC